jgi:replicative DNA helicase
MTLERAVERAVIGAILLAPERFADVREWLQLDDFEGTAERQAYAAFIDIRDRGQEISPTGVDTWIRATVPPGTQMADAPYLVEVMQETPSPTRAAVYGRMVLEMSIRRHVVEGAIRLRQRTEEATTSAELNLVFADVDAIRRALEALHRRESLAADSHSVAPAIDPTLGHLMRFPRQEELAAEQAAVLTLIEQPARIGEVAKWLRPSDFGDDESGSLFKELVALHEANNPIDRVTVAWRAAKVGIEGPLCNALSQGRERLAGEIDPVDCSRRVLEQSVKAAVIATSEELASSATDPRLNASTVAYTRLNALWPQQRRLVKARVAAVSGPGGIST